MKIMIFNTLFHPHSVGGAAKSVRMLAEGLQRLGHEPIIMTLSTEDEIGAVNGMKVYYIRHSNVYWLKDSNRYARFQKLLWHAVDIFNPLIYFKIRRIVRAERPDMIHTNNIGGFSTAPFVIARRAGIPLVHTIRDYNLLCTKSTMFKDGRNCSKRCAECALLTQTKKSLSNGSFIKQVVGISDFVLEQHIKEGYFQSVSSARIYNGVDPYSSADRDESDEASDTVKFLYMGRIEKTKGVHLLLDTFETLPNGQLTLAGTVHDPDIKARLDKGDLPNNIKFIGYINPDEEIHKHDAVIVPSLWNEPFGRVVIESYMHGKPVIGSKRGGIIELIRDGQTGYLFDPDDPDSLRSVIAEIIRHPHVLTEMSRRARQLAAQFDSEWIALEYSRLYNRIGH